MLVRTRRTNQPIHGKSYPSFSPARNLSQNPFSTVFVQLEVYYSFWGEGEDSSWSNLEFSWKRVILLMDKIRLLWQLSQYTTVTTKLLTIAAGAGCLLHHQKKRYHLVPYYNIVLPFCAIPYPCDDPGLCYACLPCGLNGGLLVFTNLPLTETCPRNHHFGWRHMTSLEEIGMTMTSDSHRILDMNRCKRGKKNYRHACVWSKLHVPHPFQITKTSFQNLHPVAFCFKLELWMPQLGIQFEWKLIIRIPRHCGVVVPTPSGPELPNTPKPIHPQLT